jgi:uncharacterized membrane protein YhaH (DUF805 family)
VTDTTAGQASLDAPLRGASFGQAFSRFFKKYATFHGRASRSEFWWWFLASTVISGVLYGIAAATGGMMDFNDGMATPRWGFASILYSLWGLAILIPWLALSWRRLHDTNRSGAWWFIGLIPVVGGIILLVFFLLQPDPAGARFDR